MLPNNPDFEKKSKQNVNHIKACRFYGFLNFYFWGKILEIVFTKSFVWGICILLKEYTFFICFIEKIIVFFLKQLWPVQNIVRSKGGFPA